MRVTFDDHASYTDPPRCNLLREFRGKLFALHARLEKVLNKRLEEVCTPAQRIAYRLPGKRQFLEVKVQRAAFLLRLIASKFPPDAHGITTPIPASNNWPFNLQIKVTTPAELEAAMPFVEAAYRANLRG